MIVKNKPAFVKGLILAITFLVVLVAMFTPFFEGKNALEAADRLFNSISKGSTDFFPELGTKAEKYDGTTFKANLRFAEDGSAERASKVLKEAGATVQQTAGNLTVSGDLGSTLRAALTDGKSMFENNEDPLKQKYGLSGKEALYVWWDTLLQLEKDLTRQESFKEATVVSEVVKKGIEVAYNFFGIKSEAARANVGMLTFAMVFYVVYTLWWGIAILALFDGFGMQLKKAAKKEV